MRSAARRATSVRSALLVSSVTALTVGAVLVSTLRAPAVAVARQICSAPRTAPTKLSYGQVDMANSCAVKSQPALQLEIAKLDSFEADSDDFAAIAKHDPSCALAWWGAAMSARGNPLGGFLDEAAIRKGRHYVEQAEKVKTLAPREKGLIEAMDVYYRPYKDQIARGRAYADRMDALHAAFPDDPDIAAFDGLAIIEGVDLNDKSYSRQKRAGVILEQVMKAHPDHPGAPHYLIHAFDYPPLAPRAEHAADVVGKISTASSHAQHMASHIWSMVGAWDKSIAANRDSMYIADPASNHGPIAGDIVFDHAFDFLAYARLQKGEDKHVAADLAAMKAKGDVPLVDQARYALERGDWSAAAQLPVPDDAFDAVLARFTRAYGAARSGNVARAETDLKALRALRGPIGQAAGEYWAQSDDIYAKAAQAWLLEAQGKTPEALATMRQAADEDDGHGKHIYLENKLLPMRESLADMELKAGDPKAALADYQRSLTLAPNRYRSFLGAAEAAKATGDQATARGWWEKLIQLSKDGDKARPGSAEAETDLTHG